MLMWHMISNGCRLAVEQSYSVNQDYWTLAWWTWYIRHNSSVYPKTVKKPNNGTSQRYNILALKWFRQPGKTNDITKVIHD